MAKPKRDYFRITKTEGYTGTFTERFVHQRKKHQGKLPPRLNLADPQHYGREYPPDDGHPRWGWKSNFLCESCGFVARRSTIMDETPRCPNGHGELKSMGKRLRIPKKSKLKRWLKRKRRT